MREAVEREKRSAERQQASTQSNKSVPLRDEAAKLSQLGKAFHQREMDQSANAKPNRTPTLRDEAATLIASSAASKTAPDQQQTTARTESKAEEAARLVKAGRTFHQQEQASSTSNRNRGSSLRDEAANLIKKGIAERSSQDKGQVRIRSESKAEEAARLIRAGKAFHEQDEQERRQVVSPILVSNTLLPSCKSQSNLLLLYACTTPI